MSETNIELRLKHINNSKEIKRERKKNFGKHTNFKYNIEFVF